MLGKGVTLTALADKACIYIEQGWGFRLLSCQSSAFYTHYTHLKTKNKTL